MQALQFSLGRQQSIEDAVFRAAVGIPVGLRVASGMDVLMQLHCQRLGPCCCWREGRSWSSPSAPGSLPRLNLVASSQLEAALTKIVAAGSLMPAWGRVESFSGSTYHQSRECVFSSR